MTIICPDCDELILDTKECACGWRRPVVEVGTKIWSNKLEKLLILLDKSCYPVLAQDRYVVATEEGTVIALDLGSGKEVWQRQLGTGCAAYRLVADTDLVFIAPSDSRTLPDGSRNLVTLDADNGSERYSFAISAHSLSAPAFDAHNLYFSTSDDLLYALDRQTGEIRWSKKQKWWGPHPPVVGSGVVIAAGQDVNNLVAYNVENGGERWIVPGKGRFFNKPYVFDGLAMVVCHDGFIYALDIDTGDEVWKKAADRQPGFTSPLAVEKDLVVIGSRINPRNKDKDTPRYTVLALDTKNGNQAWHYDTFKQLFVAPLIVDDIVLVAFRDGTLIALGRSDGLERWKLSIDGSLVTSPLSSGDLLLLASRDGTCRAVSWRGGIQPDLLAPEVYIKRGDHERAALAYALRGDFEQAAKLYELLPNQTCAAARLYERSGRLKRAAELWEQAGERQRLVELYQRIKQSEQPHQTSDKPWSIEQLIIEHRFKEAADHFEQIGNLERAAQLFELATELDDALRLRVQLSQWDEAARLAVELGHYQEAAAALQQAGKLEEAAHLFEQAQLMETALRLRTDLGQWKEVARLAMHLGAYDQAAFAFSEVGDDQAAAYAYEQAAQNVLSTDESRAIEFYECAFQIYMDLKQEDRVRECSQHIMNLRRIPQIKVIVDEKEVSGQSDWVILHLRVDNIGYGPAYAIEMNVVGGFEVKFDGDVTKSLHSGSFFVFDLFVRSVRKERGITVPLGLEFNYKDKNRSLYKVGFTFPIAVDWLNGVYDAQQVKHSERMIDQLVNEGRLEEAANQLEQFGKLERAAQLYERVGNLGRAVELYVRSGQNNQAHLLREQLGKRNRLQPQLGKYLILEKIGFGGFAEVFRAKDVNLEREVALKIPVPNMLNDRMFIASFHQEARLMAKLHHPAIVTVYEVGEVDGRLYIAMDLVDGPDLQKAIKVDGRLSWGMTLKLLNPITDALNYAHSQGVVHRDLKPSNILIDLELKPYISDFGLAQMLRSSSLSVSQSGGIIGTPYYIAPELWDMDTATVASDVYALACIVYEMLTGTVLFKGDTARQVMRAHDTGPQFTDPWPDDVPSGIADVLRRALAQEPKERYQSAGAFWQALQEIDQSEQTAQWRKETKLALTKRNLSAAQKAFGRWMALAPHDPKVKETSSGRSQYLMRMLAVGVAICLLFAVGWLLLSAFRLL